MGFLFKRVGLPQVVGQILAGILLGLPILKGILFDNPDSLTVVDFLSYLGIVFLLFLAGLEIDIDKVRSTSKESFMISMSSALVPFSLGFAFVYFAFPNFGLLAALVYGGALMVTSEATKVKVLMDLNSLNTHLGAIMLSAGAIDDIFEVTFLALVVALGSGGGLTELALIPVELIVFGIIVFVFFKAASKIFHYLEGKRGSEADLFAFVVIFIMALVAFSESLHIGYLIGAIAGGFVLQLSLRSLHKTHRRDLIKVTELITLGFMVPFFFANVGLQFDITAIGSSIFLTVVTIVIAFMGKITGCLAVKPFSKLTLKQLYYVGWAMNSRGAAELVIALTAMSLGLIPLEIFSALVAMSLITTITFPPILSRGIIKNPGLMNVDEAHTKV